MSDDFRITKLRDGGYLVLDHDLPVFASTSAREGVAYIASQMEPRQSDEGSALTRTAAALRKEPLTFGDVGAVQAIERALGEAVNRKPEENRAG